MRITLSVCLALLLLFLVLLGSLIFTLLGWLVRKLLPRSVFSLASSKIVRVKIRDWLVSDACDKWSVKFDVRDLGGHLDATKRVRAGTLGCRVFWGSS